MSTAFSSRQQLLLKQRPVARHSFSSSGNASQRLWARPNPSFVNIRCKAGVEPSVSTGAVPAAPPAPAAAYPQYGQPAPGEYVVQADQAGVAPPARPQEYYVAPPPPPMYPAPVYQPQAQASSGLPWFIWVGAGILFTTAFQKISELVKKGPQQIMAEMAMKQMMGAMQNQPGGGAPNPFGGAAGSPFGAGAPGSPFGAAGANPYAANPFAGFTPPSAASAVDTTATTAGAAAAAAPAAPASSASSSSRGEKFNQRISQEAPASSPLDVVEPVVKEPPPMGTATTSSSPPKAAFFQDVDTSSSAAATASTPPPPAADASAGAAPGAGAAGGAAPGGQSAVAVMMEKMLRNPEMQKMLYPYLPEPMRNPDSIEWMLNNPEVKSQMEKMLEEQGFNMPPQMLDMMQNMDLSEDKVNQQFQQLGLKPEDVMQKIMASPDIANGFTNPRVQQAIMDISANPMNIVKYQNDTEVMKVLEKVNEIFAPGMGGMPGMPPGMPMRPPA